MHEWIEKQGGAERVLDNMVEEFPDADIACLWNDAPERFSNNRVFESWMSRTPLRAAKAVALPFMSPTWRNWRVEKEYEWVLASSYVFAHHARFKTRFETPKKFIYVHTPARYLWAPELDPRGNSLAVKMVAPILRQLDRSAARDESLLAANSEFVRERILLAWGRDSRVIYPPVDVTKIQSVEDWSSQLSDAERQIIDGLPNVFLLGASRFVAYKGLDAVMDAGAFVDLPVVIAGRGPSKSYLADHAASSSVPVTIVSAPSDNLLYALYQRALAYIFPPVEDFGIMPVEAMAAGCPVLVNSAGGTHESVKDGVGGFQVERFDGAELVSAVSRLGSLSRAAVKESAVRFDSSYFRGELSGWMGLRESDSRTGNAASLVPEATAIKDKSVV